MASDSSKTEYLKLYDDFSDAIFRHCYFRVSNREKAKDIAQDTFVKVWEYAIVKNNQVSNMKALLYKTANNLIIDEYRKKKSVSLDLLRDDGFEPSTDEHITIENAFSAKDIIRLFENLSPKYRDVLVMRYVDELSPKEIADLTKESENNVSVRINRGIKQIKEIIAEKDK